MDQAGVTAVSGEPGEIIVICLVYALECPG